MAIASPFNGLRMSQELVCEFFAVFSRFEFTLKDSGYSQTYRGVVQPSWRDFAEYMSGHMRVDPMSELDLAIRFLVEDAPQVQVEAQRWERKPLIGNTDIERAIDAARRVRNNLFHGGKHTPHSPEGRDEKLVRSALAVMYGCLSQDENLREIFDQYAF